ncbi:MAG: hypothetical protein AAF389_18670 [Gemmatimonadota bacterium]
MREHEPRLEEDAKNLSVVTGSAILAALITIGLVANQMVAAPEEVVVRDVQPVVIEVVDVPEVVEVEPELPVLVEVEPVRAPLTGINRLYGTVTTVYGREFTGYIRWDKNEGSWTDLLDAQKERYRGGSSQSGIRFGHIDRIDVTGRRSARFTLRNGERMELQGSSTDLGSGLRALLVDEGNGEVADFRWRDLESVDFFAPGDQAPSESRLHGTVHTRDGMSFTGYVTWDVDEIYSNDILDGDADGERLEIPFGQVNMIERYGTWGAKVTLDNGDDYVLEGTNDVNSSIRGIEVSDATLGAVKLQWDEFDYVEFHGTNDEVAVANFDGGAQLEGTVITRFGDEYTGEIIWDADEQFTWEILKGYIGDVEFHVELSNIARIEKTRRGSLLELNDGRSFELNNTNDVDRGHKGITIRTDGREYEVDWDEFQEVTFTGR